MRLPEIRVIGIPGLPEICSGSNLGDLICQAIHASPLEVQDKDILVVTQKVVSKAEGRIVLLDSIQPSPLAHAWAQELNKEPSLLEIILRQTRRVVRMDQGRLIVETQHGFVCANAGVDTSNVAPGMVTLLPEDPDGSAQRLRTYLQESFECNVAVIISDTFGRPWRKGLVNVAIGTAGLMPLMDYRGEPDSAGRPLEATAMAWADELAAAAELVMGKTLNIPIALVRGLNYLTSQSSADLLIRGANEDLFR